VFRYLEIEIKMLKLRPFTHAAISTLVLSFTMLLSGCGSDQQLIENNQAPDPVVVDIPIAFVKRSLPLDEEDQLIAIDLRRPADFVPGASIYTKVRASASATEINITDRAFFSDEQIAAATTELPLAGYDVKDLEVSYDGQKLLFAMRAPEIEDADEDEQPTWNIWEYNLLTDSLNRMISSNIIAEFGQDTSPAYLPDGRIIFSSTRQSGNQAVLLDEGKPQYQGLEEDLDVAASVLHVMSADGSEIQQVSFNQSHDLDPTVLSNGKILFSRWDQAGNNNSINLYQMNADGSALEIMYGRHSHDSDRSDQALQFVQSRELPNGQVLVAVRPFSSNNLGGDFEAIDIENYIDNRQPTSANTGLAGPAQTAALFDNILINGDVSPGGSFGAVYPLWDGSQRVLFSWSQCRVFDPEQLVPEQDVAEDQVVVRKILPCTPELLENPEIEAAPVLYGLWIYDPLENTQQVISAPQEGIAYSEVVSMQDRAFPQDRQQADEFSVDLANEKRAQVHIRSVYDFAGSDTSTQGIAALADPTQTPVANRPIRFLRVVKSVSIPNDEVRDFSNSAYGRSRGQLMREIIGYVPVEPDGSVLFQVPANLPLAFSLLDEEGKRVGQRHQNWMQFAPGEVLTCNGCHTAASERPHGRTDAEAESINAGSTSTGIPFPNTNPALFADFGETMAQTAGRINGVDYPSPDISFVDIWTDPSIQTPAEDFTYAYGDLKSALPITIPCATTWTDLCRIQINYPESIQPIFDLARLELAEDESVIADQTCVSCHSTNDVDDMPQVPAAQLDLTATASNQNADHLTSYRELMFGDVEQEIIEGALIDRLIPVVDGNGDPVFEVDEEGELILDAQENPIPVLTTVGVANSMSTNSARSSSRFFAPFAENGSHQNWLSKAELKLIAEWLDIGGQYYNNPFAAPAD
jgi:hypothetical protein